MSASAIVLTGAAATIAADIYQQLLKYICELPTANWRLIGRWVALMPRGVFVHRPGAGIAMARPIPGERLLGYVFHYAIGIIYAFAFFGACYLLPGTNITLLSALSFGIATLAAPFFVMQPALGLGMMAKHTPNRIEVLFVTTSTHVVFGFGLYVAWLIVTDRLG